MTDPPSSAPAARRPPAGLHFLGPRSAPPGVTMADLHGVADLQARFNADRGHPRLVMILSPT
jgi:hypothetical protein